MTARPIFEAAILTVSDSVAAGTHPDLSGAAAAAFVESIGGRITARETVPDERPEIVAALCRLADDLGVALVLTTGGTGFARRDVTPEATRDVVEREAPGLAELMRRETAARTPLAPLSRAVAGIRGGTLIVNLPGSPRGVEECLAALRPLLRHGIDILTGAVTRHDAPAESRER